MAAGEERFGNTAGKRHFFWLWLRRFFAVTNFFCWAEPSLQRHAAQQAGRELGRGQSGEAICQTHMGFYRAHLLS